MEERPPRKRILPKANNQIMVHDDLSFIKNKCSPNARKIGNNIETTHIDFWIDKHYHIRNQHGDDFGKREGIEQDKVYALVTEAIKHLMFYSATVKNFTFINHNYDPKNGRSLRIVCQQEVGGSKLNVVIEAHCLKINLYEITIITAMQNEDYRLSDGQYAIEILGNGNSVLLHSNRGKIVEISSM